MILIEGETMATTYQVKYFDSGQRDFKPSIDSILVLVNRSINVYDSTSDISRFNTGESVKPELPYLVKALAIAQDVHKNSGGAFDPTVMPLVNLWGFGPDRRLTPDSSKVDSLRELIGFNKVKFNKDSIWKTDKRTQLDFGGIGQGYGADVVANFLRSKGVENMFVEIGGEGLAFGVNKESGKPWEIGILDPIDTQRIAAYIKISDRAFTTSGNYYNYRIVNGQRYSHTIDPSTGYPAEQTILSASVFAKDCATADAWATALMVMGHEKGIEVLADHPELDAFLVYSTSSGTATFVTKGIQSQLEINP